MRDRLLLILGAIWGGLWLSSMWGIAYTSCDAWVPLCLGMSIATAIFVLFTADGLIEETEKELATHKKRRAKALSKFKVTL